jgi:hypothetical protein
MDALFNEICNKEAHVKNQWLWQRRTLLAGMCELSKLYAECTAVLLTQESNTNADECVQKEASRNEKEMVLSWGLP